MKAAFAVAGLLALAGCAKAPATQGPAEPCRIADFLGDWVNGKRTDEGVTVDKGAVTILSGAARSRIAYVASRDFDLVSRQVLRQEFPNLAALGSLPPARSGPQEVVCAIHLIRPGGAAALVANGRKGLVLLEESGAADPPGTMHLRRGKPAPLPPPDLQVAPK
ncbi:hypothetical protein [Novosphingobium sp. BL-52-GroH]|uniref:hypothetical protein n=1 Tax=Novosphingobium sp. BL-52-GroH TaxID=3349877 RepID=UPI00384FAD4C